MKKRGNYFVAMYDKNDNHICNFNSIEECALYFKTSNQVISNFIFKKKIIEDKYRLFKFDDPWPELDNCKSL